jgi:YidC/Oxa1 family membrane protein insertase
MEKRLILAIALSLLVLLTWSAWVSKTYHIENKEVTTKNLTSAQALTKEAPTFIPQQEELPAPSLFNYSQEKFEITFIEPQAAIKEVTFKDYQDYKLLLQYGFLLGDKTLNFKKESITPDSVVFVHSGQDKIVTKKFIFSKSNYNIDLEIKIQNLSSLPISFNLPLILGALDFSPKNLEARFQDVTVATKEKTLHLSPRRDVEFENLKFLSLRDRYFCVIVEPGLGGYGSFFKKLNSAKIEVGLSSQKITLPAGQQLEQKFRIYLGPQDLRLINRIQPEWSQVIYYGTFDFISQILLNALEFLYRLAHNWGWAIVILSLGVYLLLFPLTLKQMSSMKQIQALQPKVEELRKTYKDNPQKLNKEIMELYRQYKVNPLGGCLPLVLQMPIFFALYQTLMRSAALKGARFLWIKDLSAPDRLFILPVSLPILGNEINILPILMTVGMFIQQRISAGTTTSVSAEQQKLMMVLFPLLFGFIFYHMPSGLVLYWFINSTLMLFYQIRMTRLK